MIIQARPAAPIKGVRITGATAVPGPPLTPLQTGIAAVCLVLLLWVAYRIGVVILRLVA